jgi:hypothetical protein
MRILIWEHIRKELEGKAAFNVALLRAIDPRLITHRPRDPEKIGLMKELGLETSITEIADNAGKSEKHNNAENPVTTTTEFEITITTECEIDD